MQEHLEKKFVFTPIAEHAQHTIGSSPNTESFCDAIVKDDNSEAIAVIEFKRLDFHFDVKPKTRHTAKNVKKINLFEHLVYGHTNVIANAALVQLQEYLKRLSLLYGVLTTYNQTVFLKWSQNYTTVRVSPQILSGPTSKENPTTLFQAMLFFADEANDNKPLPSSQQRRKYVARQHRRAG